MLSLILYFLAKDCQKPGQFKPVDGDQCSYIECLIQSEPWKDAYGNIRLDEIKRSCAPGVGVPMDYMSGYDNPCTIALNECQPIRKFYVCLLLISHAVQQISAWEYHLWCHGYDHSIHKEI